MHKFLVALFVVFSLSIALGSLPYLGIIDANQYTDTLSSFEEYAVRYNKSYQDKGEFMYRFGVWKSNLLKSTKLNEDSRKKGGAYFGITQFSDLTLDEFREKYLMKMPTIPQDKLPPNNLEPNSSIKVTSGVPASFDWRNEGPYVTGVYNQGSCGSCWAFSATENHESRWAIQHRTSVRSLSVQQIIDCDYPSRYGCNGGWPYQAWEYIEAQGGQDSWSCYPYVGQYEGCRWNAGCNAATIVSWSWIYPGHEYDMLLWTYGNGPISICVDAEPWLHYNGGVFRADECATQTDHCVLITGWDVSYNPPYWTVRNSWGTGWGYDGYIPLQYGANTCGLAEYPASCHTCNNCP